MKISWKWLSSLLDTQGLTPERAAELLTLSGLEVEGIARFGAAPGLETVVVGQIQAIEPHPNADKLVVCAVDAGQGAPLQIVCGARNMKAGDKVPVALVGTTMPGDFQIKKSKLRGVVSEGMLCAADELGLGEDEDGLMLLPADLEIGRPALEALDIQDTVLEISVTPNRPDALSHLGVARDLAALTGRALTWPGQALRWRAACRGEQPPAVAEPWRQYEGGEAVGALLQVELQDPEGCPRYAAAAISNLQVGPSPRWMRNRLMAVGQRPIHNLVDVTNYVLLECGQPLHAFDLDKLRGGRLIARRAAQGEAMTTLDGQARALAEGDLVIADAEGPVGRRGRDGRRGLGGHRRHHPRRAGVRPLPPRHRAPHRSPPGHPQRVLAPLRARRRSRGRALLPGPRGRAPGRHPGGAWGQARRRARRDRSVSGAARRARGAAPGE
jgi:phenylalanyl-tRNA synthetase beta chain